MDVVSIFAARRRCSALRHATAFLAVCSVVALRAQMVGPVHDLTELDLEDLVTVDVSAAAKRVQPLFQTPSAVSVLSGNEIRRFGFESVPEALRMVPGVYVARNNQQRWSVGVRGFSSPYSTKLLVLADGRNVYSPYLGGVEWQEVDIPVEDIARVEVVRGPGATLWGANAVNGVLNIISKSSRDTQGSLVAVRSGSTGGTRLTLRHGGAIGRDTWYRVYARAMDTGMATDAIPEQDTMHHRELRTGFRIDRVHSPALNLTLQGDLVRSDSLTRSDSEGVFPPNTLFGITTTNANLLGRLDWKNANEGGLTVQLYADYADRNLARVPPNSIAVMEDGYNIDLDISHRWKYGERHQVVWGGGYRAATLDVSPSSALQVREPHTRPNLFNLFAQDEITLVPDTLRITLGSKLEHHKSVKWQVQPTARIAWMPSSQQTWWASVSRAIRSPAQIERDSRILAEDIPATLTTPRQRLDVVGDSNFQEEVLVAYEIGWRRQFSPRFTADATAYFHDYDGQRNAEFVTSFDPTQWLIQTDALIRNNLDVDGYGCEIAARWKVTDRWQIVGDLTLQRLKLHEPPGLFVPEMSLSTPSELWSVRSSLDLPHDVEFSAGIYRTAARPEAGVPSSTRVDAQITWRPRPDVELSVGIQDAFDRRHREYEPSYGIVEADAYRNIFARCQWRF